LSSENANTAMLLFATVRAASDVVHERIKTRLLREAVSTQNADIFVIAHAM
jgi:hypothetical protein